MKSTPLESTPHSPDPLEGCQAQHCRPHLQNAMTHSGPTTHPLFNGCHDLLQVVRWEGLLQKCIKLSVRHQDIHHLPAIKSATGERDKETASEICFTALHNLPN